MEETAADAGGCIQACHLFRHAGEDGDRRAAQSRTGHRRLPADGGHTADDPCEDDRTQPCATDLHRRLRT